MAKLNFVYGTMGSGKTIQALVMRYNLIQRGKNVLFLKPAIDDRDGQDIIRSRIGIEARVDIFDPDDDIVEMFKVKFPYLDYIIVDEIQFATKKQIEQLKEISELNNIPVYTFGIRTDFKTSLFPGTKRLFELADNIEQIETICECGDLTCVNARIKDGKIVRKGPVILIGGDDTHKSICYSCYKKDKLRKKTTY